MLKMIAALAILIVLGVGISQVFADADTTSPVVEVPPNYTIDAVTGSQPTIWGHAVILNWDETQQLVQFSSPPNTYAPFYPSDNVGVVTSECTVGGIPVEQAAQVGFPIGITTVTCTATDAAGNVGTGTFTITVVLEGATDMYTVPDYTGDTDVISLQEDLAEVTLDLTNALETIGILQTQVASLQSESVLLIQSNTDLQSQLANAVVDVSPYTDQIDSLAQERDQWKQLAENWYAVALEQVRVMVDVLGL